MQSDDQSLMAKDPLQDIHIFFACGIQITSIARIITKTSPPVTCHVQRQLNPDGSKGRGRCWELGKKREMARD